MNVWTIDSSRKFSVDTKTITINLYEDGKFVCYLNHFRDMKELRSYVKEQWNILI